MQLTPAISLHLASALSALLTGPVVIWTRRGGTIRPAWHRVLGYGWVAMMLTAALSALFIRDFRWPNLAGYTPIHLLVPLTLGGLVGAFRALAHGAIRQHRQRMQSLYFGACVGAGAFTLLPGRYLGQLVWGQWLGWL